MITRMIEIIFSPLLFARLIPPLISCSDLTKIVVEWEQQQQHSLSHYSFALHSIEAKKKQKKAQKSLAKLFNDAENQCLVWGEWAMNSSRNYIEAKCERTFALSREALKVHHITSPILQTLKATDWRPSSSFNSSSASHFSAKIEDIRYFRLLCFTYIHTSSDLTALNLAEERESDVGEDRAVSAVCCVRKKDAWTQ